MNVPMEPVQPGETIPLAYWLRLKEHGVWDRWALTLWGFVHRSQPFAHRSDVPVYPDYTSVMHHHEYDTLNMQHVHRYYVPLKGRDGLTFDDPLAAIVACELGMDP